MHHFKLKIQKDLFQLNKMNKLHKMKLNYYSTGLLNFLRLTHECEVVSEGAGKLATTDTHFGKQFEDIYGG